MGLELDVCTAAVHANNTSKANAIQLQLLIMQMPVNCTGVQIHTAYVLLTIVVLKIPCRVVLSVLPTSCTFSHTPHSANCQCPAGDRSSGWID